MKGDLLFRGIEALPKNWQGRAQEIHCIEEEDLKGIDAGIYDHSCPHLTGVILAVVVKMGKKKKLFRLTDQRITRPIFERFVAEL